LKLSRFNTSTIDDLTNHERRFVLESTIHWIFQARGAMLQHSSLFACFSPVLLGSFGAVLAQYYCASLYATPFVSALYCYRAALALYCCDVPSDVTVHTSNPAVELLHAVYFHLA